MKLTRFLLAFALPLSGCAQFAAFQASPGVQQAEEAAIGIGLTLATGSPAFASLAPIAVNGLTALANGKKYAAVTGNTAVDVPLIVSTVSAMIPNSSGKAAALAIGQAYAQAQPSPSTANATIDAIASGLDKGVALANSK